jgi:DNA-binding transcriptional regulator GbsR (MarR family)
LNVENVDETKKEIKRLMAELDEPGCESKNVDALKDILEKIGSNNKLMAKYKDVYNTAADALMMAGISATDCKCDPLRKHIPTNKQDGR